jgi:hypothetical protein
MRTFALGLLLVACSGGDPGTQARVMASDAAGSGGAGTSAAGGTPSSGGGGEASASAGSGGDGSSGAAIQAGGTGSAGTGTQGGGAAGAAAAGTGSSAGSVAAGGTGGATTDPLAPFPAPGCEDWTAYRIPRGKFLAVTGNFDVNGLRNGQCMPVSGAALNQTCDAAGNVDQCVCTVSSPPSCGQFCDGDYLVTVLKAEPGKAFMAELRDGDGHCVSGVPVSK